ncbi:uncharacterized protein UBRO_21040 [Ustilago bromivora]|uniref:Uncharacterized protein n=1 Tax=Ustilago bromivora TaxID=307758 RepID=A0A1K0GWM6_9BASI|nr:uncharacterized protein UBRO_21040 [Ustilago bromivora]
MAGQSIGRAHQHHPSFAGPILDLSNQTPPTNLDFLIPGSTPPPRPQALPAAVLALPSAGQTSGTSVSKEPSQPTHLTVGPGGVLVGAKESSDTHTSAFVKTIPNIAALTQIWLAYITIRVHATGNLTLNEALLVYLVHLIECDHLYQWRAVTDYHLALGFVPSSQDQHLLKSYGNLRPLPQVQCGPTMPWLQPPPHMPALSAKAPNDTMSNARWQGYHQPSFQEGDLMVRGPLSTFKIAWSALNRTNTSASNSTILTWFDPTAAKAKHLV